MSNPIIDAIVWDPDNPGASAILLQTQLDLLQAEWDTKTSRFLKLTSVGAKSLSSFEDLPRNRDEEIDLYVGLDPAEALVDSTLRRIRGQLLPSLPYAGSGHKERRYLTQTSVLNPNPAGDITFLYQETIVLPRPAYVRGFHPLVLKSSVAAPCSNLFRPQIDGTPIYDNSISGAAGITFWPLQFTVESYVIVEWATTEPIDSGSHSFEMDIIDGAFYGGGPIEARVAPFFNLYTSAIEVGTMPITYVQPPVSYLEFIYQ